MNFISPLIWIFACGSDNEVRLQKKSLRAELNTYDVGSAPFGSRTKFPVVLESIAAGKIPYMILYLLIRMTLSSAPIGKMKIATMIL